MNLLAYLQARSEEVGECWEWQLSFHRGGYPMMRLGRSACNVRRAVLLTLGVDMTGKQATYKCGNPLCVRPEHQVASSRAKIVKRLAKTRIKSVNLLQRQRMAAASRKRGKLTLEQALEIRESSLTQRQLAKQYGICQAMVAYIKAGKYWLDYSNPFAQLFGGTRD